MTQPQPPLPPRDGPDERIDLLAPDGAPPPRERPVRPRELDAIPLLDPSESSQPERGPIPDAPPPERASEAAPREADRRPAAPAAGEPVESAIPCASCGYDLRGRPSAPRCPECGAEITAKARAAALPVDRAAARDEIFDGWQRLAGYSLASVVLASPLVYIVPLGVGVASCVGFASGFRLLAMRGLRHLPAPLHASLRDRIATWFWLERTQVAIAAAITLGGLISTVGLLDFLGNAVGPIYFLALAAWWTIAMLSLVAQVRIGDRIAQGLVDPAILPLEVGPRLVRMLRWNLALGLLAALLGTYSVVAIGGNLLPGADIAARSAILMLAATGIQIALAVRVHAHAVLVANCIFESDYFRPDPNRPRAAARGGDAERNPNAVPPERRHAFTPKRDSPDISWSDDAAD